MPGQGGLRGFLSSLAQLAVAGVHIDTGWLFAGRDALDVTDLTPPRRPGWTVDGHLVRTADGDFIPSGLVPARRIKETTLTQSGPADSDALLTDFLRTSREMVAAQRDVLLAYLGTPAGQPAGQLVWQPAAQSAAQPAIAPVQHATPAPPAPAAQSTVDDEAPVDVLGTVLQIISERTGYPTDMIELDLDLEADLSIDSIKRTEIAGELATRLGAGVDATALDDAALEDLANARTARAIADWLLNRLGEQPPAVAEPAVAAEPGPAAVAAAEVSVPAVAAPKRLVPQWTLIADVATVADDVLAETTFLLLGEGGPIADAVRDLLVSRGSSIITEQSGPVDGVIHLGGLTPGDEELLPEAMPAIQAALHASPRWLVAAYPTEGSDHSAGVRGLFRTIEREYPGLTAKAIAVNPVAPPAEIAKQLVAELLTDDRIPVVRRVGGARYQLTSAEEPLPLLATIGAGPAGDGVAEMAALGLDRDSVVVLIGGARGITAQAAVAFAAAGHCRLELIGRTPLPNEAVLADATDKRALRAALIAQGLSAPAEIEQAAAGILAGREVVATLAELRELGAAADYHAVDVRDEEAMHQVIKEIYTHHGRIDGIVYAAGVIEDRWLADKDVESFRRVFATKVDGARSMFAAIDELRIKLRFVVLFGSVAAVWGNRGQADYAAANDALETIGQLWAERSGARCLTVHWGPWAPTGRHGGMVSPELQQEFTRRGVALIDPEEGTGSLLRELAWGSDPVVAYTASGW